MTRVLITDDNYTNFIHPVVNGERMGMGLVPRDFSTHPLGYCAGARPFDLPLIDESEWEDRLAEQIKNKAHMETVRDHGMNGQRIPSQDQDGIGYCWNHSVVAGAKLVRAFNNQPYVDLSPFAIGCIIKGFRDQGGWNQQAMDFLFERGCPSADKWPQRSMKREHDNPATWEEAALYKGIEGMDLDPQSMKKQLVTCLLTPGIVVASDFNWWGHSVLAVRIIKFNPFTIRIWNSWKDSWGTNGMGDLEGTRAIPNGATALRAMSAAA